MSFSFKKFLIKNVGLYPPYLGAGISVKYISKDMRKFVVGMKLRWYNKNLFGTHFGGSLYAMCDPFFVFIVLNYLGEKYVVWDIGAKIRFVSPGKSHVEAIFAISEETLSKIKTEIDEVGKKTYHFTTQVTDVNGKVVAEVEKEVYVRKKDINS